MRGVEELEQALRNTPPEQPVERAELLTDLAMAIRESEQWDRMLELAREARQLSTDAEDARGIARSILVYAFVEYIRADYGRSLKHCMEALTMISEDEDTEAWARAILALVQWSLGNFDEAIRHGTFALEVFRRLGNPTDEAYGYTTRGGIYYSLGRYDEAIESQQKALDLFRSIDHIVGQSRALSGVALTLLAQGRSDEALSTIRESLELARRSRHTLSLSRALNDYGEILASRGEYEEALRFNEEALAIRRREGYRQAEATSLLNLGRIYAALGQRERAIDVLEQGLRIAMDIGAKPKARDFHQTLMTEYDSAGDFGSALRHSKAYIEMRAQIATDQATARQQAIELESKLLWAQKDAEIQRLRNVELKRALDELQATQAELVNSEKLAALGSLVAAIAHEINTPLGVIQSASDMTIRCAERLDQPHPASVADVLRSNAQLIAEAAARIGSVIRRLKAFAGIDQAPYAQTSISELVENTVSLLEPEFGVRIVVERQYGETPLLYCYAADLGQVLVNLLRNAAQAIDADGRIFVRTEADDEWVRISVADTGRGIQPEHLERIFDAGFNRRESRVKASLSLFASSNIVRRHGGEIRVESRVGEGSTFTILLPRSLERAEQSA